MNRNRMTALSPISITAAAILLAPALVSVSAYIPFGYQSDSTHTQEYRSSTNQGGPITPGQPAIDPSSFAGSIHYDPLHNALYMTGATYGSGPEPWDGLDVYNLANEQSELNDENTNNDGVWWEDMATGLKPHLKDVGVPEFSAVKGDCFYAVLGLPVDNSGPGDGGSNMGDKLNGGGGATSGDNQLKVVHSRRFGSESALEACSAIDVLFASPYASAPGGYLHNFEHLMDQEHNPTDSLPKPTSPSGNPFPSEGPPVPSPPAGDDGDANPATPDNYMEETPSPPAGDGDANPTTPDNFMEETPGMMETFGGEPTGSPWPSPAPPGTEGTDEGEDPDEGDDPNNNFISDPGPLPSPTPPVQDGGPTTRFLLDGPMQGSNLPIRQAGIPQIRTRSVRLLIAGHVESQNQKDGYIIDELEAGHFDEAKVYAFAQQVDIRLPVGNLGVDDVIYDVNELQKDEFANLDYDLTTHSKVEEEVIQKLGEGWTLDLSKDPSLKEDLAKVVTSGVESRALLNDHVDAKLETLYPVSLVADPTSKKHYYVVMLASTSPEFNPKDNSEYWGLNRDPTIGEGANQRSWSEWNTPQVDPDSGDNFGPKGLPNYGKQYRIVVKKMSIEAISDTTEFTDAEMKLSAKSYEGEDFIAMRGDWVQEFRPDREEDARPAGIIFAPSGDAHGVNDVLIMVGTTAGRGSAFGTASEDNTGSLVREDLDGFVTKIHADTGANAGQLEFDVGTNSFENDFSLRINSNPGQDDIVAGVCAKPLRAMGKQDEMKFVYVVGSTTALLDAIPSNVRSDEFLSHYSEEGPTMEAFLMKVDISTMKTVWTVQVGAIIDGEHAKGNAFGYGCAVTRDGLDVYLTGLVKETGVVTDFSQKDFEEYQGLHDNDAHGGSDIFVSSYKTFDGSRNFLKQVGSTKDDFPSRGNGGVTTDRFGNAILTGNTRGSMMRKRDEGEFRYGQSGKEATMEVFIMSFDRTSSDHVPVVSDGGASLVVPVPQPEPVIPSLPPPTPPPTPEQVLAEPDAANQEEIEAKNGGLVGVVALSLVFILLAVGASAVVVYRIRSMKMKERDVLMDSNLHGGRQGSKNLPGRRRSIWGETRSNSAMKDFGDLNIMVEVRNSASGGWHGVYDDEQLQAIDFGAPAPNASNGDTKDVVEQSLFMEDGLQEIEDSMSNYEIGDMNMDDVTDEELIKAYNDAMALDIEPENPDVEFAMAGLGSELIFDEENHII